MKTISKIGNSAGITLDKMLLELLHVKVGDQVTFTVRNGSLIITPANVGFSNEEVDKAAAMVFVVLNGHEIRTSNAEVIRIGLAVADGSLAKGELPERLRL